MYLSEEPVFCFHNSGRPKDTNVSKSEFNEKLTERIIVPACGFGRYGYRRIHQLLAREGWQINHKCLEMIWRQEGLKVPSKQLKRSRLWFNDGSCLR